MGKMAFWKILLVRFCIIKCFVLCGWCHNENIVDPVLNENAVNISQIIQNITSGDTVLIPNGSYNITQRIELKNLSNITISAANATDTPAVIFSCIDAAAISLRNSTNVTILGISFENCSDHANLIGGGAGIVIQRIPVEEDDSSYHLILDTCWFINCHSKAKTAVTGGAVLANNTNILIRNCRFIDNHIRGTYIATSLYGGALAVWDSNVLNIHRSIFNNNYIDISLAPDNIGAGGAVSLRTVSNVLITETVFFNNSVRSQGAPAVAGAIYQSFEYYNQRSFIIENSILSNNSCVCEAGSRALGGAIYMLANVLLDFRDLLIRFSNVTFINNSVISLPSKKQSVTGSVVNVGAMFLVTFTETIIENCRFENNVAIGGHAIGAGGTSNTGALGINNLPFSSRPSVTKLINTTCINNLSMGGNSVHSSAGTSLGGGFVIASRIYRRVTHEFYFINCTVMGNQAIAGNGSSGEAAYSEGGGAYIYGNSINNYYFQNCKIINNSISTGGTANDGKTAGGGLTVTTTNIVNFTNCEFSGNLASSNLVHSNGAAVYVAFTTEINVQNCVFENNTIASASPTLSSGAGIYSLLTKLNISASVFHSNQIIFKGSNSSSDLSASSNQGGAIFSSACCNVTITNTTLSKNSAYCGGAFAVGTCALHEGSFQTKDVHYVENRARYGGAVYLPKTKIEIPGVIKPPSNIHNGASFFGNVAEIAGGVIYIAVQNCSDLDFPYVYNSIIRNNSAGFGGVFFFEDPACTESITSFYHLFTPCVTFFVNALIAHNTATLGGSVMATPKNSSLIPQNQVCSNCTYIDNTAPYQTTTGYATPPSYVVFGPSGCPSQIYLSNETFSVQVILKDAYQTTVIGSVALQFVAFLNANETKCKFYKTAFQTNFDESGSATFGNISLQGSNGDVCELSITAAYLKDVMSVSCSIKLSGCPENYKIVDEGGYDSCKAPTSTEFVIFIVSLIIASILLLIGAIFVGVIVIRRWILKRVFATTEIPDLKDNSEPMKEIINNPDISKIDMRRLEMYEQIGAGAAGRVFRAIWHASNGGDDVEVALKCLMVDTVLGNDPWMKAFVQEIKLQSHLHHENILSLLGVAIISKSEIGIVQPLMKRGSIDKLIESKGKHIPDWVKLRLAMGAAKGLLFLHSKNVLHRDVKPANILIDTDWTPKVADFGSSIIVNLTAQHTVMGTPVFAAPEVLKGEPYGLASDVYSFGVTMANLFTGVVPYSEPEYVALPVPALIGEILDKGIRPNISTLEKEFQVLISECFLENPKERPTMEEIYNRLKRCKGKNICVHTSSKSKQRESVKSFADLITVPSDSESESEEEDILNPLPSDLVAKKRKDSFGFTYTGVRSRFSINADREYSTFS